MMVSEIETGAKGEFTADVAVFGNVDRVGDRILEGAFSKAIKEDPPPPLIYNHDHKTPPIGETVEWKQTGKSLRIKGQLFVDGDDDHPVARMVHAGMKSRNGRPPALRDFSFVYGVPEGGATMVRENAKSVRNLSEIRPVAEIGPALLGVNPLAGTLMAPKGIGWSDVFPLEAKAVWTTAYIDDLPDSAFLYVAPGGTVSGGKTSPSSKRYFPYKDASGAVDLPHLRDAIDRAPDSDLSADVKATVQSRGRRLLAAQQGKAILLSGFESKAWDDIDSYCVSSVLEMLDDAVSYIASEDDPGNVAQMQTIAKTLLAMVDKEFGELGTPDPNPTSAKSLWLMSRELFVKSLDLPSDHRVTVGSVATLLLAP